VSLSLTLFVSRRCQLVLLRKRMASATTFAEWVEAAFKYDTIQDKVAWTLRKDSTEYDADLIDRRLRGLKALRRGYDATDIAYVSRARVHLPEVLYGVGRRWLGTGVCDERLQGCVQLYWCLIALSCVALSPSASSGTTCERACIGTWVASATRPCTSTHCRAPRSSST
jgi:hypothetical protein